MLFPFLILAPQGSLASALAGAEAADAEATRVELEEDELSSDPINADPHPLRVSPDCAPAIATSAKIAAAKAAMVEIVRF